MLADFYRVHNIRTK